MTRPDPPVNREEWVSLLRESGIPLQDNRLYHYEGRLSRLRELRQRQPEG